MAKQAETTFSKQDCRRLAIACLQASNLEACAEILRAEASRVESLCKLRNVRTKSGKLAGMDWVKNLRKLANGLQSGRAVYKVFNKGNSKLPFYSYSELPEFTCPGAGECLRFCYSFTGWRYPASFMRQLQNTLFMRFRRSIIADAFNAIRANKEGATVLRLYVDGDIASLQVMGFWFMLLNNRPEIQAYGYSKSWELFRSWAKQGLSFPGNYVLNLSSGSRYDDNEGLKQELKGLTITRGEFIAVALSCRIPKGFKRFESRDYHNAVREAGRKATNNPRVFSCPGQCGNCLPGGRHACGVVELKAPICIGEHN